MSDAPPRAPAAWVSGGNGFLGSHLVDELLRQGFRVTCLVRPTSDTRYLRGKAVRLVTGDLAHPDPAWAGSLSQQQVVFHVAGATRALSYAHFLQANAQATDNLLRACVKAPVPPRRFVLVSSVGATGPAPPGEALSEEHAPGQRTDYGRSKAAGEEVAQGYRERMELVILRPTAIYGPRDRELLPVFRLARAGLLPAFAGPRQVYDLAHVSDIVAGIILASRAQVDSGQVFLLGAAGEVTIQQFAQVLGRVMQRRVRLLPLPRALLWLAAAGSELQANVLRRPAMLNRQKIPELVGSWRLDISKARRVLGYAPRWELEAGLRDTLRWYRQEGLL